MPPGLTNVVQISAGHRHTCALKSDGHVQCWGGYEAPAAYRPFTNSILDFVFDWIVDPVYAAIGDIWDIPTGISHVTQITS